MDTTTETQSTQPRSYARIVEASKRVRWEIDRDVIRGRALGAEHKFLPDGLSLVGRLDGLDAAEARLFSQIQGRTYAAIFGLVERFIAAKVLHLGAAHALGDQTVLEAMVRFSDDELKHQELFRRLEAMAAAVMPAGYRLVPDPDAVARVVLQKSTWAVLALTCHIELFTLVHYKESIAEDDRLSPLFRDALLFHFKEESQHALLDELEWRREDARLSAAERDAALDDFLGLVAAVDGILQSQADADAAYFVASLGRDVPAGLRAQIEATFRAAYRFQYITSGIEKTRFAEVLMQMLEPGQRARVERALAPLLA
jgi:hypothetical protein